MLLLFDSLKESKNFINTKLKPLNSLTSYRSTYSPEWGQWFIERYIVRLDAWCPLVQEALVEVGE